ncbi:hypothetical protein LAZ67_2003300 [Cordylochernes scorpioides]|uniref:Integrase catalytic domain-containing protein n=1 Tax=Cordylochernes scorpioides TaxID=51811 RepID=A0ABY6K2X5_9ARAC|nr:hypothetical protein LAZ67_2003300 [Cordylochernes scorpioides]
MEEDNDGFTKVGPRRKSQAHYLLALEAKLGKGTVYQLTKMEGHVLVGFSSVQLAETTIGRLQARFLRPPDLLAPERWPLATVGDFSDGAPALSRSTRAVLLDSQHLGAFCQRLLRENASSSYHTEYEAETIVLRGSATPITSQKACRALDSTWLQAHPTAELAAWWTPTVDVPCSIPWADMSRNCFSGHGADVALRIALHALPHPDHPASRRATCGSSDGSRPPATLTSSKVHKCQTIRQKQATVRARSAVGQADQCVQLEVCPDFAQEQYFRALEAKLGKGTIYQLTKMEGHILVGLSSVQLADKLIEEGHDIEDATLWAFPLRKMAERIVLGNVLFFVEEADFGLTASRNVMSLQSTLDKGFEMKMDKKGCKLFKTTTGEVIVEGKRLPGGLYGMLITSIKPENAAEVNLAKTQNVNMLQLWHERFGHQNKRHVQKWLKEQGIDAVMDNEPCEACIYGKQHRLSFGSREQYASTQPGNLIHVDVCGPMQEVSKGGMRYFVCFKDDFTKYRSVYFLKGKSQVIEKLEQFLLETKTTGHIVKEILTDGGKEFVNKETSKITNKYGINHRITMPYTPQQNGSAERENRTLIEAARSMIYAKNMSLKLWAEAVNTATYVLNRTGPTQIEGKTPYELWFDKKPAVDHLRIFGTECFVHVPDEKRRKLDAKSEKGIFVGYCSNKDGYRIWMPNSNKVVTSRDVIFKETIPTFSLDIEKRNKELSSNQIDEQNDTQDIEKIESNVQTSDVYNLRDRSNISKPQRYIDAEINIAEGLEPKTYKEAMDSPNAQFWKEAMNEEMNSLTENDVYECTTLPPGQKPIDCKWVLKTKLNSKGEITRYKARLVAKGFAQKKGIDYEETFSPVARHDTIRTLLAIAANEDLKLVQFDIKTAFLYGDLQDQIYIKQPEGFNNGTDLVWKLKKSLYGLKQSPRCWNQKIVNFMKERCLKESTADPCLFFRKTNDHLIKLF